MDTNVSFSGLFRAACAVAAVVLLFLSISAAADLMQAETNPENLKGSGDDRIDRAHEIALELEAEARALSGD